MTSVHETARRLRTLVRHLESHPTLPPVVDAGTAIGQDVDVSVAGAATAPFLAWCGSVEHPRVKVFAPDVSGQVMLWCDGVIEGYRVRLAAHVADLPELGEWDESMPLIGFRHVLAKAGWSP